MSLDLHIDRDLLLAHLVQVQQVIEPSATSPMSSHVLLSANDEGLRITATDTVLTYRGAASCNVAHPGQALLDARKLYSVAKTLPEPTVRLQLKAGRKLHVRSGRAKFRLNGLAPEDYFVVKSFTAAAETTLAGPDLLRLFEVTAPSISEDDVRYGLNGLHLEVATPGVLRGVSTDGHRMALVEVPHTGEARPTERCLVSRKMVAAARKMLDKVTDEVALAFGDGEIAVTHGDRQLWGRMVEGEFPDWTSVVPTNTPHVARVAATDLRALLRRAALLQKGETATRFAFGEDEVEAETDQLTENLPIELDGEPLTIGFSATYLRSIAGLAQGDTVELQMSGPLGPARVVDPADEHARWVVMPMRLS